MFRTQTECTFKDNRKLEEKIMPAIQLHEDKFLKISWEEKARVIGSDWKEATSSITDEDFKAALTLFAGHVEILIAVKRQWIDYHQFFAERILWSRIAGQDAACERALSFLIGRNRIARH
jgi:hypothetical protein